MTLEKAIKQTNFGSQLNKGILNIIYTAGQIECAQTRFFKQYDISQQQFNVLRILRGQYPNAASMGLIQDRMIDQMSNASRLVEKLKLKNFVERKECLKDRRQVDIKITDLGLELLEKIDQVIDEIEARFGNLTEEEYKLLNMLLDKFNSNQK